MIWDIFVWVNILIFFVFNWVWIKNVVFEFFLFKIWEFFIIIVIWVFNLEKFCVIFIVLGFLLIIVKVLGIFDSCWICLEVINLMFVNFGIVGIIGWDGVVNKYLCECRCFFFIIKVRWGRLINFFLLKIMFIFKFVRIVGLYFVNWLLII